MTKPTNFRRMNRFQRHARVLWLLAVACASVGLHSVGDETVQRHTIQRTATAETQNPHGPWEVDGQSPPTLSRLRGVNSCAAASCHGGGRLQEGIGFAASQIWARSDPHSRAWEVLTGPAARKIMAFLNTHPGTAPIQATEDTRCLNCHVTTEVIPAAGATIPPFQDHDGVGCESCHGPAGDWLAVHSTPEWKSLSAASRHSLGFLNNNSLVERAKLCASCHVGGEGRNVTHDLLAAGHPRLDFEFSTFHANVPRHWTPRPGNADENGSPELREDFAVQAWFTGQLVTAHSALELLEHRTTQPDLWPDFAEHSCFNCHHDLEDQNWYQTRSESGGRPAWGTWNFGLYPVLSVAETARANLQTLKQTMQHPVPDRQAARNNAAELRKHLDAQLRNVDAEHWSSQRIDDVMLSLIRHCRVAATGGRSLPASSWDGAAQLYLALRAAVSSRMDLVPQDPRNSLLRQHLEVIRQSLLFQKSADSPGNSSASRIEPIVSELQHIERLLAPDSDISPINAVLPDDTYPNPTPSAAGAASSEPR